MPEEPALLSDWYELVEGETLEQGDLLEACPLFETPRDLPWPLSEAKEETLGLDVSELDVVILSQSCDLVAGQKSEMWQVLLCPVWTLSEAARVNRFLDTAYGKEHCRQGHLPAYHMIDGCRDNRWTREVSVAKCQQLPATRV